MKRLIKDSTKIKERTLEINVFEKEELVKEICATLKTYLERHKDVKAIAANQFGYENRLFALNTNDGIKFFINPMITKQEGVHVSIETCCSLEGRKFLVPRYDKVNLAYQNDFGIFEDATLDGEAGDIVQQQVQLLDGVLISDFGLELFDDFDNASDEEKQELIDFYLNSLKEKQEKLKEEIDADPETKKVSEAIDFLTKAASGEVQVDWVKKKEVPTSKRKLKILERITKNMKHKNQNYTKKKKKKK